MLSDRDGNKIGSQEIREIQAQKAVAS